MKSGDMVLQSEMVAKWSDGKRLAFIGDGDAISVCVALLKKREIFSYGPTAITVFDFDQRICNAITRFAEHEQLANLDSQLYNCIDAFPQPGNFDCFYTNPPWGQSNGGESVKVFLQRGVEATGYKGEGMIVIADDSELAWPQQVLANTQRAALDMGHYIQKMQPKLHLYHLDDNPDLHSCNLIVKALTGAAELAMPIATITDPERLANFYGREQPARIRYIREKMRVDYGKAHDDEYEFEMLEAKQ
jgi:predicted methyltransferase